MSDKTADTNEPQELTGPKTPDTGACPHWATDFDHAHPMYNANAAAIWQELRGSCPVAHTDRYGGAWLPTRHEDVRSIAYDTEHFSSVGVVVSSVLTDWENAPLGGAPPITSDPPAHHDARRLLLPAFAPKAIEPWEPEVRALCRQLLDEASPDENGVVDAAVAYAAHIPVNVISRMLGLPLEDAGLFRGFVHDVLEAVDIDPLERMAAFDNLTRYIDGAIEGHRHHDGDDLTCYLIRQRNADGEPLSNAHIGGSILLLLIAGIDTTWSAIGSALHHLAEHPADLERLVREPALMPAAIEELLRAYAPVTMARVVAQDVEIGGVTMRRGEWTLLPFPAANRDPQVFTDPDTVDFDREENRHSAFGLGIHRCIGSNLARLELRVAVEEFINRYPRFAGAGEVTWSVGQVRGPRRLPLQVR
jgi:cytochrome P450